MTRFLSAATLAVALLFSSSFGIGPVRRVGGEDAVRRRKRWGGVLLHGRDGDGASRRARTNCMA
jgi:hypothetical protein